MKPRFVITLILLLLFLMGEAFCQDIQTVNTSSESRNGRYNWEVHLLANQETLNSIKYVEYKLHPTFEVPIVKVSDKASNFELKSSGWGEFKIVLKVVFNDGSVKELNHQLSLGQEGPNLQNGKPSLEADKIIIRNLSQRVGSKWWSWTVYLSGNETKINSIRCVRYILHPTFSKPIREICTKGNIHDQYFPFSTSGWGTFRIKIKIFFKNGETQDLYHDLVFN